jgi:hypothetical protein
MTSGGAGQPKDPTEKNARLVVSHAFTPLWAELDDFDTKFDIRK